MAPYPRSAGSREDDLRREDLERLGVLRLNVGSGAKVGRDYADPQALYIDCAPPEGRSARVAGRLDISRIDGLYLYLRAHVPPLPVATGAVDAILCEHLVEHLHPADAATLCSEMHRVLAPGGVLRLSTPDLALYLRGFSRRIRGRRFRAARRRALEAMIEDLPEAAWLRSDTQGTPSLSDGFLVNQVFYFWGHRWLYDFDEARGLLMHAGFSPRRIRRRTFRRGSPQTLSRWDSPYRRDESLYVEATR